VTRQASLTRSRKVWGNAVLLDEKRPLDYADVLCFFAFFARCRVEFDELTFFKALVSIALNAGKVDENVVSLLARDETETFFCVKKLNCALRHGVLNSLVQTDRFRLTL
jgi:hypothetical protein